MPCYNVAEYCPQAISSILNQTLTEFELVLLDDGSTDNTPAILADFAARDSRVKLVKHPQNKGIIASRNALLDQVNAEYIAWMDADDIAREDRLAKQVAFLESHHDYAAVSCEYEEFSESTTQYSPRKDIELSREYLLFYNYVLNPGGMVRQQVVAQNSICFDSALSGASDFQFWVDVVKYGKIGVIHEPLIQYRRHAQQESTAQLTRQLKGCCEIVQRQLTSLGLTNLRAEDMTCFLIYPADLLKVGYSMATFRTSASIVSQLMTVLPNKQYGEEALQQAIHLLRRHAVRTGVKALPLYIKVVGMRRFMAGKYFGLALIRDCIKQVY